MSEVVDLLRELIRIDSVNPSMDRASPGEQKLALYVANYLRAFMHDVNVIEVAPNRPNVVARHELVGAECLLLETHLDTVPMDGCVAGETETAVLGRGSVDAKGCLAAMMVALRRVISSGSIRKTAVLAAVMDEEAHYQGVSHLIGLGLRADGAIIGEPTGLSPLIEHKGANRFRLHVPGKAAHTARPDLGINAIDRAIAVKVALEQWFHKLIWEPSTFGTAPTMTVSQICTTTPINVVPSECVLGIDARLPAELSPTDFFDQVETVIRGVAPETRMEVTLRDYALRTPKDAPIVHASREAVRSITGNDKLIGASFGSDASKLSVLAGIPSVVLGPGDIDRAHTQDERIEKCDIEGAVLVYEHLLTR